MRTASDTCKCCVKLGYRRLMRRPIFTYECLSRRFGLLSFGGETTLAVRLIKRGEDTRGARIMRCAERPPATSYPETWVLWVPYCYCVVPPVLADYIREALTYYWLSNDRLEKGFKWTCDAAVGREVALGRVIALGR